MGMWIQRSKETLSQIIDSIKAKNTGLKVRVAFVAYRDITDGNLRFDITDFTENIDLIKAKINKQEATGGDDPPEDV